MTVSGGCDAAVGAMAEFRSGPDNAVPVRIMDEQERLRHRTDT